MFDNGDMNAICRWVKFQLADFGHLFSNFTSILKMILGKKLPSKLVHFAEAIMKVASGGEVRETEEF